MPDARVTVELMPTDASDENDSSNYLFHIAEFESEQFNATTFFVKYKAVYGSLDQMYEELKQYRDELNKSLYQIINLHYKDFISITSKLDGVDSRVHQHMTMPLLEIIDDIKGIYTTLHGYTAQMRQKIRQKQNIQQQKRVLKGVHSGILHYKEAERHYKSVQALANGGGVEDDEMNTGETMPQRHKCLLLYAQYKSQYGCSSHSVASDAHGGEFKMDVHMSRMGIGAPKRLANLECLVVACRELEQCSVSLTGCAQALFGEIMDEVTRTKYADVVTHQKNQLNIMVNQVLQIAKTKLAYCLNSHYDSVVNHAAAAAAITDSTAPDQNFIANSAYGMSKPICDSITHCVRVLLALQSIDRGGGGGRRGGITAIEQVVAEFVFEKCLKLLVNTHNIDTQNFSAPSSATCAVDSSTVRHSYQGLPEIFASISGFITTYMGEMCDIFVQYRYHDQTPDCSLAHDVVVNSVLLPAMHLCANAHSHKSADGSTVAGSNIFNVAIPAIFHHCYASTAHFIGDLDAIVLKHVKSRANKCAPRSIRSHLKVQSLNSQWNTSIYYQLRSKEVISRVTASYASASACGLGSGSLLKTVYGIGGTAASGTPVTLSVEQLNGLLTLIQTDGEGSAVKTTIVSGLLVELHTLVHHNVFISALSAEFMQLLCRLFGMLRVFMLDSLGYYDKSGLVQLRFLNGVSAMEETGSDAVTSTKILDVLNVTVTTNTVVSAGDAASAGLGKVGTHGLHVHTAPELLRCSADLLHCIRYTQRRLLPLLVSVQTGSVDDSSEKLTAYLSELLELQAKKLHPVIPVIYDHLLRGLLTDLRGVLQAGIEAVPTRYRMTNKPAPTTCNAYVSSLLDRFFEVYTDFLPASNACLEYLQQFTESGADGYDHLLRFVPNFIQHSAALFAVYVQKSLKMVKELEGRLNKRNKQQQAPMSGYGSNSGTNLATSVVNGGESRVKEPCVSDLDKIQCQYCLDVSGFIDKVYQLHIRYETERWRIPDVASSSSLLGGVTAAANRDTPLTVADKVTILTVEHGYNCVADLYNEIKEFEKFV